MVVTSSERIAIDMDEVLADFVSKHLALCNAEFGKSVTADHRPEPAVGGVAPVGALAGRIFTR